MNVWLDPWCLKSLNDVFPSLMLADFMGLAEVIFSEIASPCFGVVVDALIRINECEKHVHEIISMLQMIWLKFTL